jgi:hypothetical protein
VESEVAPPEPQPVIDAETIETPVTEAVPEEAAAPTGAAKPKRRRAAAGARTTAAPRKARVAKPRGKKKAE